MFSRSLPRTCSSLGREDALLVRVLGSTWLTDSVSGQRGWPGVRKDIDTWASRLSLAAED